MRKILTLVFVLSIASCHHDEEAVPIEIPEEKPVTCDQSTCWDSSVYVCRDSTYIKLFTRSRGWTGGDATYSVDLKNGKTLWMFGDTFLDQVSETRTRPSFRLINNSLVLQDGTDMKTFHGGTAGKPEAFAKPPEAGNWYWPGDGTVAGGKLFMFMHGFGTGGGGAWDFYRTSIDLLTINPETMAIEGSRRLYDDPTISWGAAILEDTDYTYIYGVHSESFDKKLFVARTNADLTADFEYFNGTDWNADPASATSLFTGVSEEFSIFKRDNTYYFLTQDNLFGKEIRLYTSSSPEGPFGNKRVVYCTPETNGNIYTYNAFAHDHIYQDSLLVSYNVNSFDSNDLLKSADNYRPYFIKIGGWKVKP